MENILSIIFCLLFAWLGYECMITFRYPPFLLISLLSVISGIFIIIDCKIKK